VQWHPGRPGPQPWVNNQQTVCCKLDGQNITPYQGLLQDRVTQAMRQGWSSFSQLKKHNFGFFPIVGTWPDWPGLVSITAGCANMECGSAFAAGLIGAFVYQAGRSSSRSSKSSRSTSDTPKVQWPTLADWLQNGALLWCMFFFTHWQTGFNEDWGFIPSISPMINLSGFKFGPNLPKFRTAPLAMGSWSITMNRDGQEAIGYGGLVIYVQTGSGLRGSGLRVCLGLFGFVWGSQLKGCGLLWKLVHGYPFRFSRVFFPKSDRVWGC
jgi:hypothetical protein